MKPRLLVLFCGAGGCSAGYYRAEFDVVGVDIMPQKHYPFAFILGDAIDVLRRMMAGEKFLASDGQWYGIEDFDAIHASPPCQGYSKTQRLAGKDHPMLIGDVRTALIATSKPYIIENVGGAPLINPLMLCGSMFGLRTMRPRFFECSFPVAFQLAPPPAAKHAKMGRMPKDGEYMHVVGNFAGIEAARVAMDIDWMNQKEIAQAIPPAYTQWIGKHLLEYLGAADD